MDLANLLYPNQTMSPEELEARYPERNLPEGAKVTRFAPSPTGFVHFGGLLPTRISERLAHQGGGVFILRIEDTDQKRKVEGAEENLLETYNYFGIQFDEGVPIDGDNGQYGPYRQSARRDIYATFAKKLVSEGKAYPCFCTEEELTDIRTRQEAEGVDPGYYGKWAVWRDATPEQVKEKLDAGVPFVVRFKSQGDPEHKMKFTDLVKGEVEITENHIDHVLLKSDGIPTYHFAHAVDDHLMRVTHVVRGEEWLPSLPFHIQLFKALGFKLPKYLHCSQLMKMEGDSKKKLSKRDKAAALADYKKEGYDPVCITEYIMTLLNSNYEEWRTANPDKPFSDFPFAIKKLSASGSLFDYDKLDDIARTTVSRMSADEVYAALTDWAAEYDPEFAALLTRDACYTKSILAIGRGGKKPRKDITKWSGVRDYAGFFFDELFAPDYSTLVGDDVDAILTRYAEIYDETADQTAWFDTIKALATEFGYAAETKVYKNDPHSYKGHVGDISNILRVAVTGRTASPDMYAVMQILGRERVLARLYAAKERN